MHPLLHQFPAWNQVLFHLTIEPPFHVSLPFSHPPPSLPVHMHFTFFLLPIPSYGPVIFPHASHSISLSFPPIIPTFTSGYNISSPYMDAPETITIVRLYYITVFPLTRPVMVLWILSPPVIIVSQTVTSTFIYPTSPVSCIFVLQ